MGFPRELYGEMEAVEMLKKTFLVLGLVGCLTAMASADVLVSYGSADDADPGTTTIELNESASPIVTSLNISVSSTTDAELGGGISFMFGVDAVPELGLSDFVFDPIFDNVNSFFADPSLPNPVVIGFGPGDTFDIPAGPASTAIATVAATIDGGLPVGTILTLGTGAEVFDNQGAPLAVDPASDNVVFEIVPEPATLALLLIGGFSALRRRR